MDDGFRLETDRLRLRIYRREDVDELARMFSDAEHMRYYPAPFTREQTEAWIERQLERYRDEGFGLWVIEDKGTGAFLGTAGPTIQVVEGVREVEIGWHVKPGHKGRGIAPEAACAARDWAFERLDVAHLISLVRPANVGSVRVAEKIGMHVDREADYKGLLHRVYRIDRTAPSREDRPAERSPLP